MALVSLVEGSYVPEQYKKGGSFSAGANVQAGNQALLYTDGMYYAPPKFSTFPIVIAPNTAPPGNWICVGYLKDYPVNHIRNFGAVPDNSTDNIEAFDLAISYIRKIGGGVLIMGDSSNDNYRISRPWKLYSNMTITGYCRVLPTANFASDITFRNVTSGTTERYDCMAYFNDGTTSDDPSNFGYAGLEITKDVVFDGQYRVQNGLILEGITGYVISCEFSQFAALGIWAKYYCWGGTIDAYVHNVRTAFLSLGAGANAINLNGFRGWGDADFPSYGLLISGPNSGIDLSGAFVERMQNGILVYGDGGVTVSAVDFEQCNDTLIHVMGESGTVPIVTVINSFLESGGICILANGGIVHVQDCRVRASTVAFETRNNGIIYERNNLLLPDVGTRAVGTVHSDNSTSVSRKEDTRASWEQTAVGSTYEHNVYSYAASPNIPTATWNVQSQLANPAIQRMLMRSDWLVKEMRNGVEFSSFGIRLDGITRGEKDIVPTSTGVNLGTNASPFSSLKAIKVASVAGVGVGVNPEVPGELVLQFTSNGQATIKGMGTDGVIRAGNITLS